MTAGGHRRDIAQKYQHGLNFSGHHIECKPERRRLALRGLWVPHALKPMRLKQRQQLRGWRADDGDLRARRRDLERALDKGATPPFGEELGRAEAFRTSSGEYDSGDHARASQRRCVTGE